MPAASARNPPDASLHTLISERSRGPLVRMSRLPPLVVPGLMLVLMLIGLAAPLWLAVPAFAVIALFVLWLAVISWPVLSAGARLIRAVMVAIVVAAAVARLTGWL